MLIFQRYKSLQRMFYFVIVFGFVLSIATPIHGHAGKNESYISRLSLVGSLTLNFDYAL